MTGSIKIPLQLCALAVVTPLLNFCGIIGFHYTRSVDNDPISSPAEVKRIRIDRIELKDGRTIKFDGFIDTELANEVRTSGGRIGVEVDASGLATVFIRQQRFICGLGTPFITIPLIRHDVPRYVQKACAWGTIEGG